MPSRIHVPSLDDSDPLANAISPPPDESAEEMQVRVQHELEAKRVSDAIDEDLDRQRAAEKKAPKPIRVLLLGMLPCLYCGTWDAESVLGQSESGLCL